MDDLSDVVIVCPHCGVKSQHKYLNKINGRMNFKVAHKSNLADFSIHSI